MYKILFAVTLLALVGCERTNTAIQRDSTNNVAYQVDTLFTKDGCTVYRFLDEHRYRYFVRCDDGQTRTEWTENCGKSCERPVEVPTADVPCK